MHDGDIWIYGYSPYLAAARPTFELAQTATAAIIPSFHGRSAFVREQGISCVEGWPTLRTV